MASELSVPPPLPGRTVTAWDTPSGRGELCQGSVVCQLFPPLVSIFGLFPVLVWCDYWLILVQPCLSSYLWFTCVFIVLSVQYDFVWSTRYSPVFLVCIKDYYLSLRPRLRVVVPPCCVHRDTCVFNVCCIWFVLCLFCLFCRTPWALLNCINICYINILTNY